MKNNPETIELIPSASRLVETFRNVGYDFKSAIADLVDNSIEAGATKVEITGRFNSGDPWIRIVDNGQGMSRSSLNEALRFGSNREYRPDELGKFGLGLKTATHSQCRNLIVATKQARDKLIQAREHDLDHLKATNRWEVKGIDATEGASAIFTQPLSEYKSGTVVLWRKLDRVFNHKNPSEKWIKERLYRLLEELERYLGMIFHRFLSNEIFKKQSLEIFVNKNCVEPMDPFCRDEPHTKRLDGETFNLSVGNNLGRVIFTPYVLPTRKKFSTPEAYLRSGRGRWTASQGLWVYRANRLIQDGGWSKLRTTDEHTKYARASLDFSPELDELFEVNIAKMRVNLPQELRQQLDGPITTLLRIAKDFYKSDPKKAVKKPPRKKPPRNPVPSTVISYARDIGKSIDQAASNVDEREALYKIKQELGRIDKRSKDVLGW